MKDRKRLLLLEDDAEVAHAIKKQADAIHYRLHIETDGRAGFFAAVREKPDLMLIDITLPKLQGLDVCKKIKCTPSLRHIPLILLNHHPTPEEEIILGLELGADDYLLKPLSIPLLFARIKTVLRRTSFTKKPPSIVNFGPFTLEVDRHLLRKEKELITLTLSEFNILKRLLTHKGKTLSRRDLIHDVHKTDPGITTRNIDVHVASLRKKLGSDYPCIQTVHGIGYQFAEPMEK